MNELQRRQTIRAHAAISSGLANWSRIALAGDLL